MEITSAPKWSFFQNELKGFVYKRVKDKALTEDIVQDVFLKVHAKLGQLKNTENASGWIYQITRNVIADHFRSKSKSIAHADIDWESDKQEFNHCVASCLSEMLVTLPSKYREALELTEMQNLSQIHLAERLNISYSAAKSRVQRARQMLKEKMDEQYLIKTDTYGNIIVCEDRVPCKCNTSSSEICG